MFLHYASHSFISVKSYYIQISVGWVRWQQVTLMWRGRVTQLRNCDIRDIIPLCVFPYYRLHMDNQWRLHAVLIEMNTHDLSGRGQLHHGTQDDSWTTIPITVLRGWKTHLYKHSYPLRSMCSSSINISSRWLLTSILLSPSSIAQDNQTALWHDSDSDNMPMLGRTPTVHFTTPPLISFYPPSCLSLYLFMYFWISQKENTYMALKWLLWNTKPLISFNI